MHDFNMLLSSVNWFGLRLRLVCFLMLASSMTACGTTQEAVNESAEESATDSLHFYLNKLPDKDFIEYYGGEEHPRVWYRAAEELGRIGWAAIPLLIERLDSPDPYEVMLALYALMLASQDFEVIAETDGEYIQLGTVLTESTNESNRKIALDWWDTYGYLWVEAE